MRPLLLPLSLLVTVLGVSVQGLSDTDDTAEEASEALRALAASIRSAPTRFDGAVTIETNVEGGGTRTIEEPLVFAVVPDRMGRIEFGPWQCGLVDGEVTITHAGTPHFYWKTSDDDSPYYTLLAAIPDLPLPLMALCFGEESGSDLAMQYHWKTPWLTPSSVERDEATGAITTIRLASDAATSVLRINPETQLPASGEVVISGGDAVAAGTTVTYRYEYTATRLPAETTARGVGIVLGKRQRAGELASLIPAPSAAPRDPGASAVVVGTKAPDLMLATPEGLAVSIDDFPGHYVVVDFWASWCGPCMRSLPHLQTAAAKLAAEGLPVTVLTVNIAERVDPDAADKVAARHGLIEKAGRKIDLTLPVLVDYDNATAQAWSINQIPRAFVIDPEGTIVAVGGSSLDYVSWIKAAMRDGDLAPDAPASTDG